jgi:hypothetical protein
MRSTAWAKEAEIPTLDDPTPRERRRIYLRVALRALGSTALLLVFYYLLPMDASIDSSAVAF